MFYTCLSVHVNHYICLYMYMYVYIYIYIYIDCKIKPLAIYHSENQKIFKRDKVMKSRLYIYNIAVLIIICRFLINVVKICKPLSKLDLPTLRKGSIEERTQRNK